ncbi:MAG: tetratricopeptide repeat protein [bacterium]
MGIVATGKVADKFNDLINKVHIPFKNTGKSYEHCIKADALRIQDYFLESIAEYKKAISFDKDNFDAYRGLGFTYKALDMSEKMVESFEIAKKLSPFDKEIYVELGMGYLKTGEIALAMSCFRTLIKLDPDFTEAWFQLAMSHELLNENEMAIDIYNKIILQKDTHLGAYNNLGSLYMRLGKHFEAAGLFLRAIEINPQFSRAFLGLAIAFDKMERVNDAIRYYKKYLEMKPNSANTIYIIERLEALRTEKRPSSRSHLKLVSF